MSLDLVINRTIVSANAILINKAAANCFYGLQVLQQDAHDFQELHFAFREETLEALRLHDQGSDVGSRKQQLLLQVYRNLSKETFSGRADPGAFLRDCVEIIEEFEAPRTEEQKERQSVLDADPGPSRRFVITSHQERLTVRLNLQVKQFEVWLSDFDVHKMERVSQVQVFKLKQDLGVTLNQLTSIVWCSCKELRKKPSQAKILELVLGGHLEKVERVLSTDLEVKLDVDEISIGHTVVDSWHSAREVLLNKPLSSESLMFAKSDILEPTKLRLEVTIADQYKLKNYLQVVLEASPLKVSVDFKDVAFMYLLFSKVDKVIKAQEKKILAQMTQRLQAQVTKAIKEVAASQP